MVQKDLSLIMFFALCQRRILDKKNRGSYFVLPKQKEEGDEIKDERRLFYVALTRARKHICISFCNTPLRFIDELDQNYVLKNKIKEIKRPHIAQTIKKWD